MKKTIRLNESEFKGLVKRLIREAVDMTGFPYTGDALARGGWWKGKLENDFPGKRAVNGDYEGAYMDNYFAKKKAEAREARKAERARLRAEKKAAEKAEMEKMNGGAPTIDEAVKRAINKVLKENYQYDDYMEYDDDDYYNDEEEDAGLSSYWCDRIWQLEGEFLAPDKVEAFVNTFDDDHEVCRILEGDGIDEFIAKAKERGYDITRSDIRDLDFGLRETYRG